MGSFAIPTLRRGRGNHRNAVSERDAVGLEFRTAGSALSLAQSLDTGDTMATKTAPPSPRAQARPTSRPRSGRHQRDAIAILKADHREVERLFKAFEKTSDRAHVERRKLVDSMIEELSRHAAIEEQIVYPWARDHIVDADDMILEAVEEHGVMKFLLGELAPMSAEDERFTARTTVLMENVRHHVKEEESGLFLDLRDVATRAELLEFGRQLEAAKRTAPTNPGLTGALPAVGSSVGTAIDHARDIGRDVVNKVGALTALD
jgi:hemerythrin superfamily protein